MTTASAIALVSAALVAGCHVHPGNGDTVTGAIAGVVFTARDAYATQSSSGTPSPLPRTSSLVIVVTSVADGCASAPALRAGSTTVEVSITRQGGEPIPSGTYDADGGAQQGVTVTALVQRTDAACRLASFEASTAGTLSLEVVEPSHVSGSFSLTFPDGSVAGSFEAPFCQAGAEAGAIGPRDAAPEAAALCGP